MTFGAIGDAPYGFWGSCEVTRWSPPTHKFAQHFLRVPLMIIASHPQHQISRLLEKHRDAIAANQPWLEIWELFYQDPWFSHRLESCARYIVQRYHLSPEAKDDICQEALIHFSRSIRRDVTLGFNPDRGSFGALVSTIIHRSCQKAVCQFRQLNSPSVTPELFLPDTDFGQHAEDELDLQESILLITEPYRTTIQQICLGFTVDEIAEAQAKSKRTIYRWLDCGVKQLRGMLVDNEQ